MKNDDVKLTKENCDFFGNSILKFLFLGILGYLPAFPEELRNKIVELKNKGTNLTEEDLEEIRPLIDDYYNEMKEEFYKNDKIGLDNIEI